MVESNAPFIYAGCISPLMLFSCWTKYWFVLWKCKDVPHWRRLSEVSTHICQPWSHPGQYKSALFVFPGLQDCLLLCLLLLVLVLGSDWGCYAMVHLPSCFAEVNLEYIRKISYIQMNLLDIIVAYALCNEMWTLLHLQVQILGTCSANFFRPLIKFLLNEQRTEVYEYAKVLGNSQYILLPFQPYKLIYAYMLAEIGKVSDSLR